MLGIINEIKKLNIRGMFIMMLVCFVFSNVIISFLYHDSSFSNVDKLQEERELYVEALESVENEGNDENGVKNICEKKIAIIDYCIENNIPYQQLSVISNLAKNVIITNFVIIFIILFISSLIIVEFRNDTWKNIVVLTDRNYKNIFWKKKMTEVVIIFATIALFIAVAILYGVVVYRNWTNVSIDYVSGQIILSTYNQEIINMFVGILTRAFVYGDIAFLLAVILKEKRIVIIGITLLVLFENTIYGFLSKLCFSSVFPYYYLQILENICNYQLLTRLKAIVYIAILLMVVNMLIVYFFKSKIYHVKYCLGRKLKFAKTTE